MSAIIQKKNNSFLLKTVNKILFYISIVNNTAVSQIHASTSKKHHMSNVNSHPSALTTSVTSAPSIIG